MGNGAAANSGTVSVVIDLLGLPSGSCTLEKLFASSNSSSHLPPSLWRMNATHNPSSPPSSSLSSPRDSEEYPLGTLDHDNQRYVTVPRVSSDSSRLEEHSSEPLLPTSERPSRPEYDEDADADERKFSCSVKGIVAWSKGPSPPHKYRVTPWLRRWQTAPVRLVDRYCPTKKAKIALLLGVVTTWFVIFLSVLHSSVNGIDVPGYGKPIKLTCQDNLWSSPTNCGLNADGCRPFDKEGFAFRCPAGCSFSFLLEPYFVGPQEVNYQSLIVGGSNGSDPGVYRGDSYICPAALHAGIISDRGGGCGILRRTGEQSYFPAADKNGMSSLEFASNFPLSYTLERGGSEKKPGIDCPDVRWPLFAFAVVVTSLLSLSVASPAAFYTSIFFIVWFQVGLASDPPQNPSIYEVVSTSLGRFLPAAFVGFAIYYFCVGRTLRGLEAYWDKTVLWLGACWVGALNTDTFDKIPISRLTPHDIQQQPGAIPALMIIVGLLILIVITQAIAFRNEGRMPKMLGVYGLLVASVMALIIVPHMNLRIHHYILSLLFLPGTTLQTRPSLLYQGLLVGLFINGIARWGFDSILQTPGSLLEGAVLGSPLPEVAPPTILSDQNIIFDFPDFPKTEMEGVSVQVNDVQRFLSFKTEDGDMDSFNWTRHKEGDPEYFRFAFVRTSVRGGFWYEDFSKPVVWEADGRWNETNLDSL